MNHFTEITNRLKAANLITETNSNAVRSILQTYLSDKKLNIIKKSSNHSFLFWGMTIITLLVIGLIAIPLLYNYSIMSSIDMDDMSLILPSQFSLISFIIIGFILLYLLKFRVGIVIVTFLICLFLYLYNFNGNFYGNTIVLFNRMKDSIHATYIIEKNMILDYISEFKEKKVQLNYKDYESCKESDKCNIGHINIRPGPDKKAE